MLASEDGVIEFKTEQYECEMNVGLVLCHLGRKSLQLHLCSNFKFLFLPSPSILYFTIFTLLLCTSSLVVLQF